VEGRTPAEVDSFFTGIRIWGGGKECLRLEAEVAFKYSVQGDFNRAMRLKGSALSPRDREARNT
jgi:hypothetical protein